MFVFLVIKPPIVLVPCTHRGPHAPGRLCAFCAFEFLITARRILEAHSQVEDTNPGIWPRGPWEPQAVHTASPPALTQVPFPAGRPAAPAPEPAPEPAPGKG